MKTIVLIILTMFPIGIKAQSDTLYFRSIDTFFYELPKDTFIEVKPNVWYNEARYEYRDSSIWYVNIEQWVFEQE